MNVNAFLQKDYENELPSGPKKTNPKQTQFQGFWTRESNEEDTFLNLSDTPRRTHRPEERRCRQIEKVRYTPVRIAVRASHELCANNANFNFVAHNYIFLFVMIRFHYYSNFRLTHQ